ncbi:hypothetical protein AB1N83_004197 [Pleurotus pulmonarius]
MTTPSSSRASERRSGPYHNSSRANVNPHRPPRDVHNTYNTNSADGTFYQVNGQQYINPSVPNVEVPIYLMMFMPTRSFGVSERPTTMPITQASLPNEAVLAERSIQEIAAELEYLQAIVISLMDAMGWEEWQRLERHVLDLRMRLQVLQQRTVVGSRLRSGSEGGGA